MIVVFGSPPWWGRCLCIQPAAGGIRSLAEHCYFPAELEYNRAVEESASSPHMV
jgi:hypothetical protein